MKALLLAALTVGACGPTLQQLPATALTRAASAVEAAQSSYEVACEPFPVEAAAADFCRNAHVALTNAHSIYNKLNAVAKGEEVSE